MESLENIKPTSETIENLSEYKLLKEKLENKTSIRNIVPKSLHDTFTDKKLFYKGKYLKKDKLFNFTSSLIYKHFNMKGSNIKPVLKLNSTVLQKNLGCTYKNYLRYLIFNQYIKRTGSYKTGAYSYSYILTEKLIGSEMTFYLNTDKVCLKNHKKKILSSILNKDYFKDIINPDTYKDIEEDSIIYPYIKEKLVLDLYKVDIDYTSSINAISNISNYQTRIFNQLRIENIRDNSIWYTFDKYGRFHTNFTTIKRCIRQNYLTINGEELKEIDIPNCQPLLLCIMLKKGNHIYKVDSTEYDRFSNLVKNGNFYKYLKSKYNRQSIKDTKKMIYRVFFGENNLNEESNKIFRKEFPSIYNFILHFKMTSNTHKSISHILQKLESKLLYNRIVKDIYKYNKGISLVTVHDSICYPKSFDNRVSKIFNHHLNKIMKTI